MNLFNINVNKLLGILRYAMPCCLFSLLLGKNACAETKNYGFELTPDMYNPSFLSNYSSKLFPNGKMFFDDFEYQPSGEITTPVLFKQRSSKGKMKLLTLSTETKVKHKKKGFRVRGLTFYYMPNENTQWRIKLRKNKIKLRFRYDF